MAHHIEGTDSVVLYKQAAWHGLGTVFTQRMTPTAALKLAGMDYDILKTDRMTGYIDGADGTIATSIPTDRFNMLVRGDNFHLLAVQPTSWMPLQNSEMASDADFIAEGINGQIETMGTLKGGKNVFMSISGTEREVGTKGDSIKPYFFLSNAHDGSQAYGGCWTGIRPVCWNTVTAALADASKSMSWTIRHTLGMHDRREVAIRLIQTWRKANDKAFDAANLLCSKVLTRDQIQGLWVSVLEQMYGEIPISPQNKREENKKELVVSALRHMSDVYDQESNTCGDSAWVAYNAVTNYLQHSPLSARAAVGSETRLVSHLWGREAQLRKDAYAKVLELV